MSSNIKWLIEDHIIMIEYTGTITTEDVIHTTQTSKQWLQSTSNTVHIINNLTKTDGLSPEFQKVGTILSVTRDLLGMDNLGKMIAFGTENRLLRFLSSIVGQVGGTEFRMFDTYELALDHITHNDPQLAELVPTYKG